MILTTDGFGRFILLAESAPVYEEFVTQATAFATVSSTDPDTAGQGTFDLSYTYDDDWGGWPVGRERRVLVRSTQLYGKGRRIIDLKFDLQDEYGPILANTPEINDVFLHVRAVTTDFDPATVTWNWAYAQGHIGLSAQAADYYLAQGSAHASASPFPSRHQMPRTAWNALDAIYGFEIRLAPAGFVGSEPEWLQVQWRARLDALYKPVGYVILE